MAGTINRQRRMGIINRVKRLGTGVLLVAALFVMFRLVYRLTPEYWGVSWRLAASGMLYAGSIGLVCGSAMTIFSVRAAGIRRLKDFISETATRRFLDRGPKIVVVGGGTGLSVLLRGLKKHTRHLTAVVAVTDDGGSSGRLRDEFGIIPPGDIRNCLTALADREPLMEQLFQYRFGRGSGLTGHNFGNLFITAMTDITGDFQEAIHQSSRVLAIRGQVLPASTEKVVLTAELDDDSIISGETLIGRTNRAIRRVYLIPSTPAAPREAVEAIMQADAVILGPGSLFTSILPNLLVPDILRAVRMTPAVRIQVVNIMTQPGETIHFTASDHVSAIHRHCGPGLVDWAVVNSQPVSEEVQGRYFSEGAEPVILDSDALAREGVHVLQGRLLGRSNFAWHDPESLAETLIHLVEGQQRQKSGRSRGFVRIGPFFVPVRRDRRKSHPSNET